MKIRLFIAWLLCVFGLRAQDAKPPCVFCEIVAGTRQQESVVYRDDTVVAFLSIGARNPGHVLVVPKAHIENLYDLDDAPALDVHRLTRPFLDYSSGRLESRLTISTRPGIPVIAS